ncbi:hypothetical protein QRX50_03670 [Amycolatopsis carbonis]|uniref:MFS transporter n=1 Tax=Amycolatopsis carbonis TaxID=715471 RepID=A0A9Y2IJ27_9PSEU|nr:hypothetical protein [Amycolatopsis sp. 2-15]WIX79911.1 hypothetical protein QRX50_03670 [Amycolatopsis sp. 2-15]
MARLSAAFPGTGREKAYGVFGMIMGSGTAIGLVLGGVPTQLASWRACLDINVVFVVVALGFSILAGDRVERSPGHRLDWWLGVVLALGAALIIQALTVVYAPGRAAGFGLAGVAVLAVFAARDRKSHAPLIPVVLFRDPTRRLRRTLAVGCRHDRDVRGGQPRAPAGTPRAAGGRRALPRLPGDHPAAPVRLLVEPGPGHRPRPSASGSP